MNFEIAVERHEKYLKLTIGNGGGRGIERTLEYIRRVKEMCQGEHQFMLVDQGLMVHMSIAQLMGLTASAVRILRGVRVAYVSAAQRQEDILNHLFMQSVANSLGLELNVFEAEDKAVVWLEEQWCPQNSSLPSSSLAESVD